MGVDEEWAGEYGIRGYTIYLPGRQSSFEYVF